MVGELAEPRSSPVRLPQIEAIRKRPHECLGTSMDCNKEGEGGWSSERCSVCLLACSLESIVTSTTGFQIPKALTKRNP